MMRLQADRLCKQWRRSVAVVFHVEDVCCDLDYSDQFEEIASSMIFYTKHCEVSPHRSQNFGQLTAQVPRRTRTAAHPEPDREHITTNSARNRVGMGLEVSSTATT